MFLLLCVVVIKVTDVLDTPPCWVSLGGFPVDVGWAIRVLNEMKGLANLAKLVNRVRFCKNFSMLPLEVVNNIS
jgi:hypothetical protein